VELAQDPGEEHQPFERVGLAKLAWIDAVGER
jgi:hypothetical protein